MFFKPTEAKVIAALFLVLAYGMTVLMAVTHQLPPACLASLLTIPLVISWLMGVWKGPMADSHVIRIAQLHMLFGLLFVAGLCFPGSC